MGRERILWNDTWGSTLTRYHHRRPTYNTRLVGSFLDDRDFWRSLSQVIQKQKQKSADEKKGGESGVHRDRCRIAKLVLLEL